MVITTLSKMIICSLKGYSNPHWYCSRVRMAGTPKIWLHYWAGRNFIFCIELYQVCGVFLVNKFCQLNMWIIRWLRIAQKCTQVYMFAYWKIDLKKIKEHRSSFHFQYERKIIFGSCMKDLNKPAFECLQ